MFELANASSSPFRLQDMMSHRLETKLWLILDMVGSCRECFFASASIVVSKTSFVSFTFAVYSTKINEPLLKVNVIAFRISLY